jgi:hypothetical protein
MPSIGKSSHVRIIEDPVFGVQVVQLLVGVLADLTRSERPHPPPKPARDRVVRSVAPVARIVVLASCAPARAGSRNRLDLFG